jgi:hypothetical protein
MVPSVDGGPPPFGLSVHETEYTLHISAIFTVPMSSEEKIGAIVKLMMDSAAPKTTTK